MAQAKRSQSAPSGRPSSGRSWTPRVLPGGSSAGSRAAAAARRAGDYVRRSPSHFPRALTRILPRILPGLPGAALGLLIEWLLRNPPSPTGRPAVPGMQVPDPAAGWVKFNECQAKFAEVGPPGKNFGGTSPPNSLTNQVAACLAGQANSTPWGPSFTDSVSRTLIYMGRVTTQPRFQCQISWGRPNTGPFSWVDQAADPGGNNNVWPSQPDSAPIPHWLPPLIPAMPDFSQVPGAPAPEAPPEWAVEPIRNPDIIPPEWREVGPAEHSAPRRQVSAPQVLPTPVGPLPWHAPWPYNNPGVVPAPSPWPEVVPAPSPGQVPAPGPAVAPSPSPVPGVHSVPRPEALPRQWATIDFGVAPSGRLNARPGHHYQRRPPKGVKESKALARSARVAYALVHGLTNAVTESLDVLEAVHDAICDSKYRSRRKHPKAMAEAVWNAIRDDKIDLKDAIQNIAYEQFMDAAIGKANRKTSEAHQAATDAIGMKRSPVSIQSRINWSQKAGGEGMLLKHAQREIRKATKQKGSPKNCDGAVTRAAIAHYVSNHPQMRTL